VPDGKWILVQNGLIIDSTELVQGSGVSIEWSVQDGRRLSETHLIAGRVVARFSYDKNRIRRAVDVGESIGSSGRP
jgi:hypothetical protein